MKLRSSISLFFYLTAGLMTLMATEKSSDVNYHCQFFKMNNDSIINNLQIKVEPFSLDIIHPSSGIRFYKDGIIFLSSSKSDGKSLPDHLSFGTRGLRYAVLKDSFLEKSEAFSGTAAFAYPTEAVSFTSDYKTIYYTNISKTDGKEKIYQAKFSGGNPGDWSMNPDPISFCTDNSIYTHPALSDDGKILVFASNRSGSFGGMDLYVSLEKGGKWSDPVNLGDAINSTSNELYPFLDSKNNLFFSSDNLQGFGGYDIYVCKFKSNTWEKPINLSAPVNTKFDDVAFSINRKDGKSAFYTVKQNTGIKSMQLYMVTMNPDNKNTYLSLSEYYTRPDISQMVILALEPAVQATDRISETTPSISAGEGKVVYRVQFLTSFNPKTRSQINVNGTDYNVFEYLYSGAYRLCAGEFSTITPAIDLQNLLAKSDYPNATIVAFKNNVLSLDPQLLKIPAVSAEKAAILTPETKTKPSETTPVITSKTTPTSDVIKSEPVKTAMPVAEVKKSVPASAVAALPVSTEQKDVVVYRVQIFSGGTGGSTKVKIDNKPYMTYEYKNNGLYRTCIGEFSTLAPAKEFQNICRKSGFPQAFVVVFKNNVRSTDPALLK
jgi:hypothetical protein